MDLVGRLRRQGGRENFECLSKAVFCFVFFFSFFFFKAEVKGRKEREKGDSYMQEQRILMVLKFDVTWKAILLKQFLKNGSQWGEDETKQNKTGTMLSVSVNILNM